MDTIVGALGPPPPSPPRKGEGSHAQRRVGSPTTIDELDPRATASPPPSSIQRIPVLTLEDLGVLRGVERREGRIVVKLTPTYTGCPATLAIQLAVEAALAQAGLAEARVETVLSPPWSTDDITEEGRRKLKEFGIAPPQPAPPARARCSARKPWPARSAARPTPPESPSSARPPARRCGAARPAPNPSTTSSASERSDARFPRRSRLPR